MHVWLFSPYLPPPRDFRQECLSYDPLKKRHPFFRQHLLTKMRFRLGFRIRLFARQLFGVGEDLFDDLVES